MSLDGIKALTFDTGGTILDWHAGFREALAEAGARRPAEQNWADRDWDALANELRRKSLKRMLNLGEHGPPAYNFDDAHRAALDELLAEHGLEALSENERHESGLLEIEDFRSVGAPSRLNASGGRHLRLRPGVRERADVDLPASGFVGFIRDETPVRRDAGPPFVERCSQEWFRDTVSI